MNLVLISKTPMVTQIFKLVCKKIDIEIDITSQNNIEKEYDIVIVDVDFIDDDFNQNKKYSKKLGAISKNELTFDKAKDFIIPRPFLPSQVENILKQQIQLINEEKITTTSEYSSNDIAEITPAIDYIETLAEDVAKDINYENELDVDESIIRFDKSSAESILDKSELSKIKDILNNNKKELDIDDTSDLTDEDWLDLSQIIDSAIDEVKGYDFKKNEIVNLVLNNHNIKDLKPLFYAIDQSIIDRLTKGEEITMRIKLKED